MSQQRTTPIIPSAVDTSVPLYKANEESWSPLISRFEQACREISNEGASASLRRHQDRDQILARDRVALLLDDGSPFLELCPFAGYGIADSSPCASLIAGIGSVNGRPTMIMSHVPTQSGGAWNEYTALKILRIMDMSMENSLPLISLVQSAGVFLPQQFRVFHNVGRLFGDLARRSDRGLPSCAIVFGSSTAGGAYQPALSDFTIFVEDKAQVFLGGPPLVKMAIGEEIDAESLGGSSVHGRITGLADHVAANEFEAIEEARKWLSTLSQPPRHTRLPALSKPPRYNAEDLFGLINTDIRKPLPMLEIVLRIVDDSNPNPFKDTYGPNLLTCWGRVYGYQVGIIANRDPVINPDEADKGAQFIRLCNQQNTPILFLHNVTGFMVGSKAEHAAVIKRGAQFVSAVSCSTVPHISIIIGASYGAGNYAMCGRSYKPRFLFTWPSGRCSVMGPAQLAGVMGIVQGKKKQDPAEAARQTQKLQDEAEADSDCYRTSAALLDDGVIDPRDTRDVVGMCLEIVHERPIRGSPSHQGVARL